MKTAQKISELQEELNQVKLVLAEAVKMLDVQSQRILFLEKENKELKELLAQSKGKVPQKDSSNSNLPPSKDKFRPDRRRSLRQKSSKKTGGQLGHKGSTLEFSDQPDQIIPIRIKNCKKCGSRLLQKNAILQASRQQIDLPPILPIVKQFDIYSNTCYCGCKNQAQFPYGIKANVQYGPQIRSLINYFSVRQFIPYQRMQELFRDCFNLKISQGTFYNTLERTVKNTNGIFETIKAYLQQAKWLGSDETGIYVNGKNWFNWVWQNKNATYIKATPTKRKDHIREFFYHGFPQAILSSDQYAAQLSTPAKGHQICYPHLYRRLVYLQDAEPSIWLADIKQVLKSAEKLKKKNRQRKRYDPSAKKLEDRLNQLLLLKLNPKKQKETLTFQKSLLKHRHAIFTFLYYKEVPPDNNSSEQAIRNAKVKMKISGFFKSQQNTYAQIRSIIDTLIKNDKPILNTLKDIESGKNICLGL